MKTVALELTATDRFAPRRGPADPTGDVELVGRALHGDARAEELLFRRHAPAIQGMLRRLLRDRSEVDDVLQETFEVAFARLPELRDPGALRGWLFQIAVRKSHRRHRRQGFLSLLGFGAGSDPEVLVQQAASHATSEQRAELALLDVALSKLEPRERTAWCLRHIEGLALEEVAHACECSLATAKRRIAAADGAVRRHLGTEGDRS